MFSSTNPFGQSSSSPFGSQSVFGQTNNANNNPFAPKPFGSTNPFGSPTGGSIFGGTSTGVFGAQPSSSPLGSTTAFGASSSPAFGSSTSAFGASSSPAFGGSSAFGQKPAFTGFGSTPTQTSPFGSTFQQQSQPAFGSSVFGSTTPFGAASSQPAFGASAPAFGSTSAPAFGATTTPAFGGNPAFGATSTPAFGATSTPAFGATSTPAFGATSTPAFGSTASPAFGNTGNAFGGSNTQPFGSGGNMFGSSPSFGGTSTPAFGATSASAFGSSTTPAFGASSSPSFNFGQSTPAFGSTPFGNTTSSFGAQNTQFGSQATTAAFGNSGFGQSTFGGQRGGSRIAPYTPTPEVDSATNAQTSGKLESISAMTNYKDKSHEELRWEDYQLGDKGGPNPAGQSAFAASTTQSSPFASSPTFGQSSAANLFSTAQTSSNPFAQKAPAFGTTFGSTSTSAFTSSPFGTTPTNNNPFGSTTSATPSPFGASGSGFGTTSSPSPFGAQSSPSPFGVQSSSAFGSTPSIFGTTPGQGSTSAFGSNTQSSTLFQTTAPSLGQTTSTFGQTGSPFGQSTSTPSFSTSSLFNTPSTGFGGNMFSTAQAQPSSSNAGAFGQSTFSSPFAQTQPAQQPTGAFGFSNFGQTQPAGGTGGFSSLFGQNTFGQSSATQSNAVVQAMPVTNPFGTLPAMPQMSIGRAGTSPSVQYGISNMPVVDKPAPVRISSLLTSRHVSQRRVRLPTRKYNPKTDGPKVPFFSDDEEAPSTPKADALFVPRENPRALVIRPTEQWSLKAHTEKASPMKEVSTPVHENGKIHEEVLLNGSSVEDKDKNPDENGYTKSKPTQKPNGTTHDDSYITLTGHRAGEAAIVYEHGADIEALMPKLRRTDYYTEPRIQELAAKERAEPGFCRRVKDFIVGRHGFGSIKFMGETDVRRLDLENLVQFNNREVIVYMDDSKKPPVGQGLNKPAEVTLLNIKCFDKKSGKQFTEGVKIEKYKEMLKRKAEDQGAEFVSYDAVKGEWKFRVSHFSVYKFGDDEDEWDEVC